MKKRLNLLEIYLADKNKVTSFASAFEKRHRKRQKAERKKIKKVKKSFAD